MNITIISLLSSTDRREFQHKQMQSLNLEYEFLDATAKKDIPSELYKKHYYDWQRPLKVSELACFFSHYAAWERVVLTQKPHLILEDDALLAKDISTLLESCNTLYDIDFINLENRGRKKFVSKKHILNLQDYKLYRLFQDRTGAAGYILFPSGAKKLIAQKHKKGAALADALITSCHQLLAYQVEPTPIIQLDYCRYYDISHEENSASRSVLGQESKNITPVLFKMKRVIFQITLGIRQLRLAIYGSKRRYISIDSTKFN